MFGSSFAMQMKFKLVLCDPLPYTLDCRTSLCPGTCHPCPSTSQTMPISEPMSSSQANYVTASDGLPTSAIPTGTSSGGILSRAAAPHDMYSEMVQCVSTIFLHLIVVRPIVPICSEVVGQIRETC